MIAYLLVILLLLVLENSLIFPAARYPAGEWNAAACGARDVEFSSSDGVKLHGWLVEHAEPRAHVLYCHGNGDCVGYLGDYLRNLSRQHQVTVFAFDYRGYGKSEGSPDEAGVLRDSAAARDWLAQECGLQPDEVVLMGRSLGGAVAVDLAARDGARGLVVQSSFTSMPDVAGNLYRFLPVRYLMRTQFNSLTKIGNYCGPLLQSHGTADELVPLALGRRLFDAAPGRKEFFEIKGGTHNDPEPPAYDSRLKVFLESLPRSARE